MHIMFYFYVSNGACFVPFLLLSLSPLVFRLSHLLQQIHQLRGCSFCWEQRMATRNTSPTPCSPSWMKSASGRVRTPNGKRQPGTPLQSATWAGSGQLWRFSSVAPESLILFVSDCQLLSQGCRCGDIHLRMPTL